MCGVQHLPYSIAVPAVSGVADEHCRHIGAPQWLQQRRSRGMQHACPQWKHRLPCILQKYSSGWSSHSRRHDAHSARSHAKHRNEYAHSGQRGAPPHTSAHARTHARHTALTQLAHVTTHAEQNESGQLLQYKKLVPDPACATDKQELHTQPPGYTERQMFSNIEKMYSHEFFGPFRENGFFTETPFSTH